MRILLGPSHELHAGIHGALTDHPAPGVEYVERSYFMCFQHEAKAGRAFSPHHDHSECEWFRVDDEHNIDLIHAARLPVETRLPWVVDADCLLLPLQIGSFFALGVHGGGSLPDPSRVRRREALMLARYASARCAAILLCSARAKRQFLELAAENDLVGDNTREDLALKTHVVCPAVPATPYEVKPPGPPSLLFKGRTFVDKGGLLALNVFERLRAMLGRSFHATVVSTCPANVTEQLASLGVDVLRTMERNAYLARLNQADIFFSPTLFESFGMALIEAAAAGAAIVTSNGPGMEHIGDLFEAGKNALFVSNALPEAARVEAYTDALATLIRDTDMRRRLGFNAHALAAHGNLSLAHHNQRMSEIYAMARQHPASRSSGSQFPIKQLEPSGTSEILVWSEQVCHWTRRRHIPTGGLRIRL